MSSPRVLVVGDVMTDIIVRPEGPIVRGSDRRALIRSSPGGSGANQAVWLAAMGVAVKFVGRVGAEDLAKYGKHFADRGVTAMLSADLAAASGMLVTLVDPDGERSFLTERGANVNLGAEDLPFSVLEGICMLVLSGYSFFPQGPRQAVRALMAEARARRIEIAVDPSSTGFLCEAGPERFIEWTRGASLCLPNEDEAQVLTGLFELEAQMRRLGSIYERVIIKRGAAGAAIGGKDGIALSLPALAVKVIDTTGAGDAFAAGFIAAQLAGETEKACLKAGIAAGAKAASQLGGQPGAA